MVSFLCIENEHFDILSAGVSLSSLCPDTGSPQGGTVLSLFGRGFDLLKGQPPVVRVGSLKAADVLVHSDTLLTCTVPAGIGSRLTVALIPNFELMVLGLQDRPIILGGVHLGLQLQETFSYEGKVL